MYSEDSFKNYIFWLKVRRVFFMLIFSIVGALIGMAISELVVNVLLFNAFFRIIIITVSTLLFFSISLLITANTGREVQDGYWKIAVLRKLTVISKKLDILEDLDLESISDLDTTNISEIENLKSNIETTSNMENIEPSSKKLPKIKKKKATPPKNDAADELAKKIEEDLDSI